MVRWAWKDRNRDGETWTDGRGKTEIEMERHGQRGVERQKWRQRDADRRAWKDRNGDGETRTEWHGETEMKIERHGQMGVERQK